VSERRNNVTSKGIGKVRGTGGDQLTYSSQAYYSDRSMRCQIIAELLWMPRCEGLLNRALEGF
jgi:hypothetical protein